MTSIQPDLFSASAAEVVAENGGRSRRSDPATSRDAARTVKAGTQRCAVLLALARADRGLTGWEASVRCAIRRPHAATTRLEELGALGMAEKTLHTRATDTGCQAVVWRVTDVGRRAARDLEWGIAG